MHDDLKPFSQSPSQNFYKIPLILKNPKVYQKSQKKKRDLTRRRKINLG